MKILDAINEQVNFELESGYSYMAMASWLDDQTLPGMMHFMEKQAKEELEHAEKMTKFLRNVGYQVTYRDLKAGASDYEDVTDVFKKALAHEEKVTANIHKLVELAREEKDFRAESMLQWFVDEQVEEEDNFNTLVTMLERAHGNWGALLILDGKLGQR